MERATIADGENDYERPLASELLQKFADAKSGAPTVIGNERLRLAARISHGFVIKIL
jgi:hypothetical protein